MLPTKKIVPSRGYQLMISRQSILEEESNVVSSFNCIRNMPRELSPAYNQLTLLCPVCQRKLPVEESPSLYNGPKWARYAASPIYVLLESATPGGYRSSADCMCTYLHLINVSAPRWMLHHLQQHLPLLIRNVILLLSTSPLQSHPINLQHLQRIWICNCCHRT